MSEVACFMLEPTGTARRGLRRYSAAAGGPGSCASYHNAITWIDTIPSADLDERAEAFAGDDRWPRKCEQCPYIFSASDHSQIFTLNRYRSADGHECTLRDAPPGAMYYADWYHDIPELLGPDGRGLVVILPNGHAWHIDGRASNCDSPCKSCGLPYNQHKDADGGYARPRGCLGYTDARPHKCWCRHGKPPIVTVDKSCVTCNAGAGSILAGNYHGFLRAGKLVLG